jgi:hypothetical protein
LELAVLPHFLEKVPEPLEQRGKAKLEEDETEEVYYSSTDLCERAESQLSRFAWNDVEYQIPNMTLKWLSPNHQHFQSRKSAEEHAQQLVEQQLFIDKIIFGYGARGQKLRPTKPSKNDALKAGRWRFLRDGLWVVGQEESWQAERAIEIENEAKRRKVEVEKKEKQPKPTPSQPKTPLQFFLRTQRSNYQAEAIQKLKNIMDEPHFTLGDAERELREVWKRMSGEERHQWKELMDGKEVKAGKCTEDVVSVSLADKNNGSKVIAGSVCLFPSLQKDHKETSVDGKEVKTEKSTEDPGSDFLAAENNGSKVIAGSVCMFPSLQMEAIENPIVSKQDLKQPPNNSTPIQQSENQNKADGPLEAKEKRNFKASLVSPGESEEEAEDIKVDSQSSQRKRLDAVDESIRRSKRVRKKRVLEMFNAEQEKPKERHVPSPWAVPAEMPKSHVEKTGDTGHIAFVDDSEAIHGNPSNMKVESTTCFDAKGNKAQARSEAEYSPALNVLKETSKTKKRPLSACPPRQISASNHWRLTKAQIELCHNAATEHFERVMYTVKAKALFPELADGFDLFRERGRGRYDMELPAFDTPEFSFLTDPQKTPWIDVVKQALGDDVVLIHKGVFLSNPGAEAQQYHQDGPHLTTQHQRPCHAVNVFVPLLNITLRNGPTEFVLGSHILGYDGYDKDKVFVPEVPAGTPIIFDYRLGHRGLANTSGVCRPIVYCTYAASANGKEFRDSVNFSRKRYHKLGELLDKPLSRDARLQMRQATQRKPPSSPKVTDGCADSSEESPSSKENILERTKSLASEATYHNEFALPKETANNSTTGSLKETKETQTTTDCSLEAHISNVQPSTDTNEKAPEKVFQH